ncbi:MAG: glycosyltransferase family 4 protein [Planctomycetota bacterium]
MTTMRILLLTHYFPPEGNAPASRCYEMAKRWARWGHEVEVVTCVPNYPDGIVYDGYRSRFRSQVEQMDGIRVRRIWTYLAANKGTGKRALNYASYMASATWSGLWRRRPDVMIASSPQFFCGWSGVLLRKLRRTPFLLEIRDIWPESIVAVGAMQPGRTVRALEAMERTMYRAADHIVTVGEGYREKLLQRQVPAEKVDVIYNGVDRELFAPREPDEALRQQYGLGGYFVCSYLGTIGLACALDVVLRAADALKRRGDDRYRFLLVGDGAHRQQLQSRAEQQGLDNIIFAGRQPKKLMPAFLSITDAALVHLRKTDLFKTVMPSKVFEAAAMKRPIILGVEGHAAEIVQRAGAGLCIEPENDEQLLDAIDTLRSRPELAADLGRSGHDYVTTHFDRDRLAADYLEMIQGVAAGRG